MDASDAANVPGVHCCNCSYVVVQVHKPDPNERFHRQRRRPMLLRSDPVSSTTRLTRSDSVFVLLLTLSLVLAASSFFTPFALAALLAGVPLSVALHRHADFGASDSSLDRLAGINIAS